MGTAHSLPAPGIAVLAWGGKVGAGQPWSPPLGGALRIPRGIPVGGVRLAGLLNRAAAWSLCVCPSAVNTGVGGGQVWAGGRYGEDSTRGSKSCPEPGTSAGAQVPVTFQGGARSPALGLGYSCFEVSARPCPCPEGHGDLHSPSHPGCHPGDRTHPSGLLPQGPHSWPL